jgi:uncharacterized membrane protein YphA (DoxX/SURF4 family)
MNATTITNWVVIVGIAALLVAVRKPSFLPWNTTLDRVIIGGVLFAAGAIKARNSAEARMAVQAYRILPARIAAILGHTLPWVEMAVALLLILGVSVKVSAWISAGLMGIFVLAISQAWVRGLSIDCGCFGGGGTVAAGHTKYIQEIVRDLGIMVLAIHLSRNPQGKLGLDK